MAPNQICIMQYLTFPLTDKIVQIDKFRPKFIYQGEVYSMKFVKGDTNSYSTTKDKITFTLKDMSIENFNLYVGGWYRRKLRVLFKKVVDEKIEQITNTGYEIDKPKVQYDSMRLDWAMSCYMDKSLVFSKYLAGAPRECIEYVALEKLCHLLEGESSSTLIDTIDPLWRTKERKLSVFADSYGIIPSPF